MFDLCDCLVSLGCCLNWLFVICILSVFSLLRDFVIWWGLFLFGLLVCFVLLLVDDVLFLEDCWLFVVLLLALSYLLTLFVFCCRMVWFVDLVCLLLILGFGLLGFCCIC